MLDINRIADRAAGTVIQRHIEAAIDREVGRVFASYEAELNDMVKRKLTDYFDNRRGPSLFRKVVNCLTVNGK